MRVTLQTASLPQREKTLEISLASLLPQVDSATVILNNYNHTPSFLDNGKVKVIHSDNRYEDGSRFINAEFNDGYTIVCDDDIEYPPDFVKFLLSKHFLYGGIVGVMGKILKPRPIKSFYRDEMIGFKTFETLGSDQVCEVLGICGILYDTTVIRLSVHDMKIPNSDICVAVYAKDRGITLTACAHRGDYLKNLMPLVPGAPSIFEKYFHDDTILTAFVNDNL